ncbi:MAG: DUF192 domain-containing protein [Candidatus Wallbacteria bacterium]|nr:DUF192 domain-containing protein [Candidatus Wallbacteria bacterium]
MREIRNVTRGTVLATGARWADTFLTRLKGLLLRLELEPGEALVLTPCNSVHMFGMLFSLDVVFCDAAKRVVRVVRRLRPFLATLPVSGAVYALEMAPGAVDASRTEPGDQLEF